MSNMQRRGFIAVATGATLGLLVLAEVGEPLGRDSGLGFYIGGWLGFGAGAAAALALAGHRHALRTMGWTLALWPPIAFALIQARVPHALPILGWAIPGLVAILARAVAVRGRELGLQAPTRAKLMGRDLAATAGGATIGALALGYAGLAIGAQIDTPPESFLIFSFGRAIEGLVLGGWSGAAIGAGVGARLAGSKGAAWTSVMCFFVVATLTVASYWTSLLAIAPPLLVLLPGISAALARLVIIRFERMQPPSRSRGEAAPFETWGDPGISDAAPRSGGPPEGTPPPTRRSPPSPGGRGPR
jgi:hypothetical protein